MKLSQGQKNREEHVDKSTSIQGIPTQQENTIKVMMDNQREQIQNQMNPYKPTTTFQNVKATKVI